jgi:hypothetical protein
MRSLVRAQESNEAVFSRPGGLTLIAVAVLSLVTEWAFLCGFVAALPFSVVGVLLARRLRWRAGWEVLSTAMGFAAFYWFGVLIQIWKG